MTIEPTRSLSLNIGTAIKDRVAAKLGCRAGAIRFGPFVSCVHKVFCLQKTTKRRSYFGAKRPTLSKVFFIRGRHADPSRRIKFTAMVAEQNTKLGLTNLHRVRQHGIEDRLKLPRRT